MERQSIVCFAGRRRAATQVVNDDIAAAAASAAAAAAIVTSVVPNDGFPVDGALGGGSGVLRAAKTSVVAETGESNERDGKKHVRV